MRIIRFIGWVIRACNPLNLKNHWTWSDCYRHAKNQRGLLRCQSRSDNDTIKQWFPKTEKESIALQIHLLENGWIRLDSFTRPNFHAIPNMGGRTDKYFEFDLDAHTFTWDNFLVDWRNKTFEQIKAELPILVIEFKPCE